jgi:hypothetical protein
MQHTLWPQASDAALQGAAQHLEAPHCPEAVRWLGAVRGTAAIARARARALLHEIPGLFHYNLKLLFSPFPHAPAEAARRWLTLVRCSRLMLPSSFTQEMPTCEGRQAAQRHPGRGAKHEGGGVS